MRRSAIVWKSKDDTYLIRKERWGRPVWEETDSVVTAILNNQGALIPRNQRSGFKPIRVEYEIEVYFPEEE